MLKRILTRIKYHYVFHQVFRILNIIIFATLTCTVFNSIECQKMNPLDPHKPNLLVTNRNIYLVSSTGQTACQGDSGGPATYYDEQFAIPSFTPEYCGSDRPDAYTCVPDYINWINNEIRPVSTFLTS